MAPAPPRGVASIQSIFCLSRYFLTSYRCYCIDDSMVQISQVIDYGPINNVFDVSPQNKIKEGTSWVIKETMEWDHLNRSTFLWIAHWWIRWQVCRNLTICHQVPMAHCSSLVCQSTQHPSLFLWRKNGPIRSSLVNLHHMFKFALSHSYTLTLWGFWNHQMWELGPLALPKIWKVASSLKHTLLR